MRYYSEDTVRRIIRIVAHTALEQSSLYADHILQNQPSVVIKEPHGRLKDVDEILERDIIHTPIGRVVYPFSIDSAPTVIEASKERK